MTKRTPPAEASPQNPYLAYRKYFVLTGLAIGFALSVCYLYLVHRQAAAGAGPVDSIPQRAVNVMLIMFATVFQASLLSKLFAWLMRTFTSRQKP